MVIAIGNVLVAALVLFGAVLVLLSAVGAIRLPDVYTRSHAISKSTTLGMMCILLGAFFHFLLENSEFNSRLLLGIVFIFMTSPVAAHLISRAAYYTNVPRWEGTVRDDLKEKAGGK
ncbi:monovalent cation/H(+) antiporter subunit G [Anoxybacillus flavithermus]|uniref:monovalent cation/H(+) antiporter subunit G n=1 Tax=Anoxybacillus flavithermus TaxID=33934 RepID=UPI0002A70710|nr:monovalent cation/H(+) antiporter subunit G [Anoxybacillus flavithermus]ELK21495.1 Na(+)/H(+) antiporter subunit G [Anoxybacillus flavithermus TNO-09.006]MBE2905927.1 Na+/H+ antiporter subunit G [Anoxybacillus flavithermus]MBE2916881.1 Na+/H+ antiporter subunit G [Anoxybacillus flavithermus]MBE2920503.1 Na+/H+ antiporter subunit G [Anoxybacillus flavithermus]MBE2925828.1 Na+/H+ antiporter subunit G [Anoxybacillus flavithermus]